MQPGTRMEAENPVKSKVRWTRHVRFEKSARSLGRDRTGNSTVLNVLFGPRPNPASRMSDHERLLVIM